MRSADERALVLLDKLERERGLTFSEYAELIGAETEALRKEAAERAVRLRKQIYGDQVFTRGLIEFTSYCKNDCHYCGLQRSNAEAERYRLSEEDILLCCMEGYRLGFRTFVLQGGEDPYFTDDRLVRIVRAIRAQHPDCAITLSIGERTHESYQRLFDAGAERYLLRHETANETHYQKLHPPELSLRHRLDCLEDLKRIGFQVGCGFMVGSPGQTVETLAEDFRFIQEFKPAMCGIGPFIPQHATVFRDEKQGDLHQTLFLLSLLRILQPNLLLPATTALGTVHPLGREMGIQAGANVVMPNLSPVEVRKKYLLYDNKICTGDESAACRSCLNRRMESIGYRLTETRGDVKPLPSPSALE